MATSLIGFVRASVATQLTVHERAVERLSADKAHVDTLGNSTELEFEVYIRSAWTERVSGHSPPEKDVRVRRRGRLSDIVREAIAEFKRVNNRSDVQGTYTVLAHLPNGSVVQIPEKFWGKYHEQYGRYHPAGSG